MSDYVSQTEVFRGLSGWEAKTDSTFSSGKYQYYMQVSTRRHLNRKLTTVLSAQRRLSSAKGQLFKGDFIQVWREEPCPRADRGAVSEQHRQALLFREQLIKTVIDHYEGK